MTTYEQWVLAQILGQLDDDLIERIAREAARRGISREWVVAEAITRGLALHQDNDQALPDEHDDDGPPASTVRARLRGAS